MKRKPKFITEGTRTCEVVDRNLNKLKSIVKRFTFYQVTDSRKKHETI